MTHQDRPKLPLFVLAAGAILLGAAALQSVLIVGPGPGGSDPHAISIDTGRPAATPPSGRSLGPDEPSQTVPSPSVEASPAEPNDQFPTAAVPDPPHNADHAVDPAAPARAAPEPAVSAGAEPPADTAPKAEPQPPATAPAAAADSAPPAEVNTAGPETQKAPEDKPVAAEPKVDLPAPDSKPAPEPEPAQVAKAKAADAKPEPVQAMSVSEDKPVAAEPKVKTPPAESKPALEPEPAHVAKTEPVEAKPKPLPAPPLPDAKPVVAEPKVGLPPVKVGSPPVEAKPAPKPRPMKAAKVEAVEPKVGSQPMEAKPAQKPKPVTAAKVQAVEPKVRPVKKKTAKADARGKSNSKPIGLAFGRPADLPTTAGKVNSGRYAASVRAAIGRHRPRIGSGGSATVAFSIGPAGGLRGVRIVRSSRKPQLDQAAIATVRSAAPFPAPPTGLNPTFSIQIFFR